LRKDLKDSLFVVEAHLLDLLELGRKLLSWRSGVCGLLGSTSEHILHHERVHATSKTTEASESSERVGLTCAGSASSRSCRRLSGGCCRG
jgi:hypothetical protein